MLSDMHIPPIHARRETARNKYFTTVAEDLTAPNGKPYTYHFIDATWEAVLVVPMLDDGRLVLERIYRHPYRAWMYEFPAGGIDHGEDPCAAAVRELEEETGYRASRTRLLTAFEPVPGLCHMRLHVVQAEGLVQTGSRSHEAMELIEVVEVTRERAWQLAKQPPVSGFLLNGLGMLERDVDQKNVR
jgi:ADP-ribose pyrophosphatase